MKNIDFYENLLSHSLSFKYNDQIKIAKELCELYKETIKKTIFVCNECPKYIIKTFESNGFEVKVDDSTSALYFDFHKITNNIKNDTKFNYKLIAKDFCCTTVTDIGNYIKSMNEKLIIANNDDVNNIIALLIDIPNYYLNALNLFNQYEYNFSTPSASLTYGELFKQVYERIKEYSTYDIAMKELAALIVLYHDTVKTPINMKEIAFLNPLASNVKKQVLQFINIFSGKNIVDTIDEVSKLNTSNKEEDIPVIHKDIEGNFYVSEKDLKYSITASYDTSEDQKILPKIIYNAIAFKNKLGDNIDCEVDNSLMYALNEQHGTEIMDVCVILRYPVTSYDDIQHLHIAKLNDKFYLATKLSDDEDMDLKLYEISEDKSSFNDVLDVTLEDAEYKFEV